MSLIKAAGIDLAKLVFSIHGVDAHDKCKLRKTIKRNNFLAEMTKLPPCIQVTITRSDQEQESLFNREELTTLFNE